MALVTWGVVINNNPIPGNVITLPTIDFGKSTSQIVNFTLAPLTGASAAVDKGLKALHQTPKITWSPFIPSKSSQADVKLALTTDSGVVITPTTKTKATSYVVTATAQSATPGPYSQTATFTVSCK